MNKAQRDIRRKKRVLEHAARIGTVRKTCRYFDVARSGFYVWKKAYETRGTTTLVVGEFVESFGSGKFETYLILRGVDADTRVLRAS